MMLGAVLGWFELLSATARAALDGGMAGSNVTTTAVVPRIVLRRVAGMSSRQRWKVA